MYMVPVVELAQPIRQVDLIQFLVTSAGESNAEKFESNSWVFQPPSLSLLTLDMLK